MLIYRLEKNNYGPCTHPRHGWQGAGLIDANRRRRALYKYAPVRCWTSYVKDENAHPPGVMYIRLRDRMTKLGYSSADLRFGCTSRQQLKSYWGAHFWRTSLALGFKVVVYDVPSRFVVCSPHQAVFVRSLAKEIQQ